MVTLSLSPYPSHLGKVCSTTSFLAQYTHCSRWVLPCLLNTYVKKRLTWWCLHLTQSAIFFINSFVHWASFPFTLPFLHCYFSLFLLCASCVVLFSPQCRDGWEQTCYNVQSPGCHRPVPRLHPNSAAYPLYLLILVGYAIWVLYI